MSDSKTIAIYDTRAEDYAALAANIEDRPRLRDFIDRLPPSAQVLDLGCGPGTASTIMADAGLNMLAWDASEEMIKIAARDPRITAQQKVFDDLEQLATETLDGVWANFSLLHAPREDLPTHLAHIARALRTSGLFMIAVKAGTGSQRDGIGRLYTYFTQDEISALLAPLGFSILRTDHGRSAGLSGEDADWFGLTCVKGPQDG